MKRKLFASGKIRADGMARLINPGAFEETDQEYNEPEGMIIGCHGRRRSGKSLSMVGMADIIRKNFDYAVMANFPLTFSTGVADSKYPGIRSGIVSLGEILNFPPELKNCCLLLDEIDRWLLSKRSQTLVSEFLEYGLNQIGKRNIWLFWATQNIQRINSHLFYHTDLLIGCQTNNHGKSVLWNMCDLSGVYGQPGQYTNTVFKNTTQWRGKYDTKHIFDPMERIGVTMDKKQGEFKINEDWRYVETP